MNMNMNNTSLVKSVAKLHPLALSKETRQLSYRKEDRAMRPIIYGCPEKF